MLKIRDGLLLGAVVGIGANLVKEAIAETAIGLGVSKYSCRRIIPRLVFSKKKAKGWKGWVMGTTTDFTVACATGVLIVYTLRKTGKDYAWLKGIMVSNGILDQLFNGFARILPEVKEDPNSNLLCKMIHSIFGITAVSLINRLGNPSLFPEEKKKVQDFSNNGEKSKVLLVDR